jgi:hypothetical protein
MRKITGSVVGYLCLGSVTLFSSVSAPCQNLQTMGTVSHPIATGISPSAQERKEVIPVRTPEDSERNSSQSLWRNFSLASGASPLTNNCVPGSGISGNINVELSCEGLDEGQTDWTGPTPDTNAAVGATEVVEFVNNAFLVLNKRGDVIDGPVLDGSLFSPTGAGCYQGGDDIIVKWDNSNQRWVLAFHNGGTIPADLMCIAVSTSPMAEGTYYTYEFNLLGTGVGHDYPKLGIWPTGYFIALSPATGICAYESSQLVVGNPMAAQICVTLQNGGQNPYNNDTYLLPADVDSSQEPPPTGQDEFFVGSVGQGVGSGAPNCYNGIGPCTAVYLYSMHVNWTAGTATVQGKGLARPIPVPAYTLLCPNVNPPQSSCIPQRGSNTTLEGLARYAMYRFAYWNDGSGGMQHWFFNHVVSTNPNQVVASTQWYEFQSPATLSTILNVSLHQSGVLSATDGNSRWMGSIARDTSGDIALGYSESGSNLFPSIYVAGRTHNDPLGAMEPEVQLRAGSASDPNVGWNWGDYSSMAIDPMDGCTFWYANEYYTSLDTGMNWHTRLTEFQFTDCTPYPH